MPLSTATVGDVLFNCLPNGLGIGDLNCSEIYLKYLVLVAAHTTFSLGRSRPTSPLGPCSRELQYKQ